MSISLKELLNGHNISDIPIAHQQNLDKLKLRMNLVRHAWGRPMTVTSGYRSMQEHLNIYSRKGIHPPRVPMLSQHLFGAAVDIYDPDGSLWQWCLDESQLLKSIDLYLEDDPSIPRVHFQVYPPRSGNRFFKP